MAVEIEVARCAAHAAHLAAIAAEGHAAKQSFLTKCAVVVVHQQKGGR